MQHMYPYPLGSKLLHEKTLKPRKEKVKLESPRQKPYPRLPFSTAACQSHTEQGGRSRGEEHPGWPYSMHCCCLPIVGLGPAEQGGGTVLNGCVAS